MRVWWRDAELKSIGNWLTKIFLRFYKISLKTLGNMITSDSGLLPSGDSCKLTNDEDYCQKAGERTPNHAFIYPDPD